MARFLGCLISASYYLVIRHLYVRSPGIKNLGGIFDLIFDYKGLTVRSLFINDLCDLIDK